MPSFDIDPQKLRKDARAAKVRNLVKGGATEGERTAALSKTTGPSLPKGSIKKGMNPNEEVVPGLKIVDIILGEQKCGKGMYYCYTDKKCKKIPDGLKMTARFSGGDKEPEEVGIDTPTQHGGNTDGKGGDFGEGLSIEDAFGNKFMEVVDLIKPEEIAEKCWKGYTQKGLKKKGKKMVPNCVPVGEEKDHEVSMAQAQLDKSAKNIKDLKKKLGTKEKNIPAWVQAKITDTEHNTDAAAGYTNKEETEMQEAKVDAGLTDKEKAKVRTARQGYAGAELRVGRNVSSHTGNVARRAAHRERDEMNKDKKDVRRGKTSGTQFQGKTGAERLAKVKSELGEAVRLPSEFGHIMAVVVMWRGKSYHIRMFFPQAKMPTKKEAQLEIEKVYPGGKVLSVVRNDLPSQFAPINSPLFKVTKEEKEMGCPKCAGKCGKGCECECHGEEKEVDEAAGEKDACYKKVKSSYSVWPSAYASGALSKCRKVGADNWGNKSEEVLADIAAQYLFNEGINEDGVDIFIEELGLDQFVNFVEGLSADTYLTEARAAKKAKKGAKSYAEVKAEIDAKEAAKKKPSAQKTKAATEVAKKEQPKKRPVLDGIARQVLKGMERHKAAMAKGKRDIETTKKLVGGTAKTVAKVAAVTHEAGRRAGESKVGQAVKKAGSAAIKAGVEKAKKDIESLKDRKEEVDRLGKSEISEKMNLAKADMGDVIKDFRDSDAPQFKGKSDKKIRQMAIAAKLEAERGEQKEDWQNEGFKQADYVKMKRKEKKHADDAYKQGPDPEELSGKYRSASRNRSFKMAGIRDAMMRGEDPRKDTRGGAYKKRGNPDEDHRANYSKNPLNNPKRRVKKPGVNQTSNVDEDWQKVNRKDKTDGLSQKAVNAYRKENPGSKLKTAVTTKPSKLKKGSKDAKRRSSFCSRMKGMKKRLTSAKTARDPDSRINKALRRWNCN